MKLGVATIAHISRWLSAALVTGIFLAACGTTSPLKPPFSPSDWPCGDPHSQWCTVGQTCCLEEFEVCGGVLGSGCPANFCCAAADPREPAARPMRAMTRVR